MISLFEMAVKNRLCYVSYDKDMGLVAIHVNGIINPTIYVSYECLTRHNIRENMGLSKGRFLDCLILAANRHWQELPLSTQARISGEIPLRSLFQMQKQFPG